MVNDHIALRTYDLEKTSIDKLAQIFVANGYRQGGEYQFYQKKLFARHYEPPQNNLPKVFISQLLVSQLPQPTQKMITSLVEQMPPSLSKKPDFLYSGRPWNIDSKSYIQLLEVSEYAAWVAAFGFRPNHFTVNVNALKTLGNVEDVNQLLKEKGIPLNTSGGEIKGSQEMLLKQSSTLANRIPVKFCDRTMTIPSCYYEFAQRFASADGKLYQGFVATSADKIFESTHSK